MADHLKLLRELATVAPRREVTGTRFDGTGFVLGRPRPPT